MQLKAKFTKKEHTDSGLALVLIFLILGFILNKPVFFKFAIAEVLVLLIVPVVLYPFTFLWLNLSDLIGRIMSKLILTIIFLIIVCPTSFIRKAAGKDTLRLKKFKKNTDSVFTERNHLFEKADFKAPY
jgi:hypothetical protein